MERLPASHFSLDDLTHAYNQSRVDYIVPMPMNVARLSEYFRVYDVDLDASCVLVADGTVVGLGMFGLREERGWITRLGVLPDARRRGAGRALMDGLMASAAARRLDTVWLEVIKGNQPAYNLFMQYGFAVTRELLIVRRPPNPRLSEAEAAALAERVASLSVVDAKQSLSLLATRRRRPNWLNETESMQHVPNLSGLVVELVDGGRGWVTYHAGLLQLTRIAVDVTEGDPAGVTTAVLQLLHQRHPNQDAVVENIPEDDLWPGFQAAGYFDTFRRIEMIHRR